MIARKDPHAVKYFEIRPEESNLILRGAPNEASSVVLKGTLVLCLSQPLRIQKIRLRFNGVRRIGFRSQASGPGQNKSYEEIHRHVWEFKGAAETLPPGNYEWPFDQVISGDINESLEGMAETWIAYRLKATIERGVVQSNIVVKKPIRIIRTLNSSDSELAHTQVIQNEWVDKLKYTISSPSKAVIYGSTVQVDFTLIPILKGLKIGKITTSLNQRQSLSITKASRANTKSHKRSDTVSRDVFRVPEAAETEDINGEDGYVFSRTLSVPRSLRECLQGFEGAGIKIRHNLEFKILLHNPDGHISELNANFPIFIFISPNLAIGDNNILTNTTSFQTINVTPESTGLTPPQYGDHLLDQLYSNIDPNTYATPGGPSGVSTPLTPRSRSVSCENIESLTMSPYNVPAEVLQARLSNISNLGGPPHTTNDQAQFSLNHEGIAERDFSQSATPQASPARDYFQEREPSSTGTTPPDPISRHSSGEVEEHSSPVHVEHSIEELSKVPSYSTACHTSARTPIREGLPSYQEAATSSSMAWALGRRQRGP